MGFNHKERKEKANRSTLEPLGFFEVCFLDAKPRACEKADFMDGIPVSYSCGFVFIRG